MTLKKASNLVEPQSFLSKIIPIKAHERTKVFFLCLLKGLLSCAFTMLKIQKKNSYITNEGAEQIAIVKSALTPIVLVLVTIYTILTNYVSQKKLLYGILIFFGVSFGLYGFLLIPYRENLTPDTSALEESWGEHAVILRFLKLYKNWLSFCFFFLSELFSQFLIVVFFWTLAGALFVYKEARRVYHLFIVSGCIGSSVGTFFPKIFSGFAKSASSQAERSILTCQYISWFCVGVICLVFVLYSWMLRRPDLLGNDPAINEKKETGKKMSFWQSMKYIFSDRYILATATLVITCALATSVVDITADKYNQLYSSQKSNLLYDLQQYQMLAINCLCIFGGVFVTNHISHKFSWKTNAYIPPAFITCLGLSFFGLSVLNKYFGFDDFSTNHLGIPGAKLICFWGVGFNIIATFLKYTFFDVSKEMVFVHLGPEARKKAKGAVDVAGSRVGKGFGSYIHVILFTLFPTLVTSGQDDIKVEGVSPHLFVIFAVLCLAWFASVRYLGNKINSQTERAS